MGPFFHFAIFAKHFHAMLAQHTHVWRFAHVLVHNLLVHHSFGPAFYSLG